MIGVARSSPANFPGVFIEADLADREKTQDLADDLIARGNVVGIVNNVGLARHERVDAVDPDVFAMVMDLNVRAALQLTQALLPGMRAVRFGRIINITSLVTRGLAFRSSYAAAKAALESITRTMAIELAADGITRRKKDVVRTCRDSSSFFAKREQWYGKRGISPGIFDSMLEPTMRAVGSPIRRYRALSLHRGRQTSR